MRFSTKIRLVPLLVAGALLHGCDSAEVPHADGYLYFGAGNYLGRFNLADGSSEPVRSMGNVSVTRVGAFRAGGLLITETREIERKDVARIIAYDLETNHARPLHTAIQALYVDTGDSLVYDTGTEVRLLRKPGANRSDDALILRHRVADPVRLIGSSPGRVLLQSGTTQRQTYELAVDDGSLSELHTLSAVCDFDNALWLPIHESLLCFSGRRDDGRSDFALVRLDGSLRPAFSLDGDGRFRLLAAIPGRNLVVLGETGTSRFGSQPRHSVWLYDLDSNRRSRLVDHQHLGESVAYRSR